VKLFHWLVTAPLLVICVVFAVANRDTITLNLWPLPYTIETRVFLLVLLPLAIGFLIGEAAAWISGRTWRRAARRHAHRIEELERELSARASPKESSKEIARN